MLPSPENVIELQKIVKTFPGVRALDGVDFTVKTGEIHGLVGENGAGKSTLIKIIAGVYHRDQGEIRIRGVLYNNLSPRRVEQLGIQFIHQDRFLVPDFTVAQSIFLGQELTRTSWLPLVKTQDMVQKAETFIRDNLHIEIPGKALIRDLSVAQQQIVQIARALIGNPSLIAFDEPTAPLDRGEVVRLFEVIRTLKERGIAIIYISHYLPEIAEICDRVTVLRNGVNVGSLIPNRASQSDIVNLMIGRTFQDMFPKRSTSTSAQAVLEIKELSRRREFHKISFVLHRGEVLGITGLLGSGRHNLAEVLYGLRAADSGDILLDGEKVTRWSASRAVRKRMGLVPKDRRRQGLVLNMAVSDNVNLVSLGDVSRLGLFQYQKAKARTQGLIQRLSIRTPSTSTVVSYLSGGNQQKVVLARWLTTQAFIYLLDEPTNGVDIGAKAEIYQLINRLVDEGSSVILISDDIPELVGLSDRILIMYRGVIVKELKRGEANTDNILFWAMGGVQDT